jgi:hypothetical protein
MEDAVIDKKFELNEKLTEMFKMKDDGTLYSQEGAELMGTISKMALDMSYDISTMVEDFEAEMEKRGILYKSTWTHTCARGTPVSMKAFARVVGTLSQHHDNHVGAHHQIEKLEERVRQLERAMMRDR